MARMARVVAAGVPHHVTQRGNRRQQVFFSDADYKNYLLSLSGACSEAGVAVWAYCLMPNHVHLILVPSDANGLRAALANTHRRYSRDINFREGWRGYLWQGRFASFPMDGNYVMTCARYIELNPVRARLVQRPADWRWSSARAHLKRQDDGVVRVEPLLKRAGDWKSFLGQGLESDYAAIRSSERTGRPLGDKSFVRKLEKKLDRVLTRRKPGPKPAFRANQPTLL